MRRPYQKRNQIKTAMVIDRPPVEVNYEDRSLYKCPFCRTFLPDGARRCWRCKAEWHYETRDPLGGDDD